MEKIVVRAKAEANSGGYDKGMSTQNLYWQQCKITAFKSVFKLKEHMFMFKCT